MAKAPKDKFDEARRAMKERIAARMLAEIKKLDLVMSPEGLHTLPHKTKERGYRQLAVEMGQEFMLSNIYVGARGQLILCFTPVDAQDYEHVEVDEKKIDEVFPLLGPAYGTAIKCVDEDFKLLILATEQLLLAEDEVAAKAEVEAKQAADVEYTANPLFGRF
jgi:hypothetical protein